MDRAELMEQIALLVEVKTSGIRHLERVQSRRFSKAKGKLARFTQKHTPGWGEGKFPVKRKHVRGEFHSKRGDITSASDVGAPYMSRCVCHGGKQKRLKVVLISCKYKKEYNARFKDVNPKSGTVPLH